MHTINKIYRLDFVFFLVDGNCTPIAGFAKSKAFRLPAVPNPGVGEPKPVPTDGDFKSGVAAPNPVVAGAPNPVVAAGAPKPGVEEEVPNPPEVPKPEVPNAEDVAPNPVDEVAEVPKPVLPKVEVGAVPKPPNEVVGAG